MLSSDERDAYFELWEEWQSRDGEEAQHQLLGHPSPVQDEMQLERQLASNGIDCGGPEGYVVQRDEAHTRAARTRTASPDRRHPRPLMTQSLPLAALLLFVAPAALAQSRAAGGAAAAAPLVIGETFTIASTTLGEVRRINVYAPPGYAESSSARLPVLYMPDGGMGEDFLHVAGLVQVSVLNGTMRPFLLVGIENTERRRDMTGPTTNAADRKIAPRVGGSAAFRKFIRTELMPRVRVRYRTTDESAIVGESLAGLFVVETFLLEPDLFDSYVAIDPSLWWNGAALVVGARDRLRARPATKKALFLASSDEPELADLTRRLAGVLEAGAFPGLTWHHAPMPGEKHSTIYHPAALRAFRLLFAPAAPAK